MNWIAFIFALEIGWLPMGDLFMYERISNYYYGYDVIEIKNTFYNDLETEVLLFDFFYIGGGLKTVILKNNEGLYFDPQAINFEFESGIKVGPINIFFRHYCFHPIMTYMSRYESNLKWEGGYEEIGIRIEGRIN